MKIAVVFLIAALSSCFNAATVPQGNCLQQLLEDDAPLLLEKLSQLLCNYKVAQQQKNNALFLAFINEVNVLLEKVGCTINNIIGINVSEGTKSQWFPGFRPSPLNIRQLLGLEFDCLYFYQTPTINNAEAIADQIATALFQYLEGLIAKVSKILQNIPIIGSILNDKILVQDIQNVGCGVLADIISEVDKILKMASNVAQSLGKH